MRLAVLSDIHGNLTAFDTVLNELNTLEAVDHVWILGDLAAFGSRPAECLQRIRALRDQYGKERVQMVRGNTDSYLLTGTRPPIKSAKSQEELAEMQDNLTNRDTALNWALSQLAFDDYALLDELRADAALNVPSYGWIIGYHGIPNDEETGILPDTPEEQVNDALMDREGHLAIGGHTHIPMDRQCAHWRVVNPGSVGMSYQQPGVAQWAVITIDDDTGQASVDLRNTPYDTQAAIQDFITQNHPLPYWSAQKMRLG